MEKKKKKVAQKCYKKSYECSLTFPHWKLAYRTISSIVQLQAGILSPSYFKKNLKNLGFFMKEQVKNHPFLGWLFIFPIFENHGYTAELNLSFENCNLSISRITLITASGSVPVPNNPLTLEIISNLCSKWQTLVGAQHNVCGHVLSPSCTHFYHYWQP